MNAANITAKTVVVTGGAGFIGSRIAAALADDNEVRVLDDLSSGAATNLPDGVELLEGDVRDETAVRDAVRDADVVFHEAAEVSVQRSVEQPRRSNDVNVGGTLNVLEAAREADARVVFASSCAIYGVPDAVPLTEDAPARPRSPYAIDKYAADSYVRAYNDLYGLETVALRYFNVYGPGQAGGQYSGVINVFVDQARRGDPITIDGDGTQTRDFVYVDDVVRANLAAATTDAVGEAFHVGTGAETSVLELAETIRDVTGSDSDIVHQDPRPGDVPASVADLTRARESLGYEPTVGLEAGLRNLVAKR
ncbi:NAD-dependent epimerase/dehydratase family protein [Halogeometricum limi]|uniref:UDP-glucose 4-epimerase n=1 Tax=Halogeometricum limi TaxID=555875 RepID=A0A1I6IL52_9EURY|nr:NAD-dependent epimerase/dehydratase family protein [Halogeometricum limi]SFR67359.1 UDP-glucose 4-epimerase [Halogeometricum limi]